VTPAKPALPAAPQGASGNGGATTVPATPCAGLVPPKTGAVGLALAPSLPPVPPERLLAALQRARAALVTRQAQLAACRTCGTEAAAYQQAAADIETLQTWLQATSTQAPPV
jgi:hypothetical protein